MAESPQRRLTLVPEQPQQRNFSATNEMEPSPFQPPAPISPHQNDQLIRRTLNTRDSCSDGIILWRKGQPAHDEGDVTAHVRPDIIRISTMAR